METSPKDSRHSLAPVAVILISLNEAHNLQGVLDNLRGWAQEIFLVDSYSQDETVEIALANNVHVVQRRFRDFGDQWNFALENLPVQSPWTMKLDPDERISDTLKREIAEAIEQDSYDAISVKRQLWFMETPMPVRQSLLRLWRTGQCRFTDVAVNEHPIVTGKVLQLSGVIEHHDSPDLHHWIEKQNRYTTAEAIAAYRPDRLAETPRLFGSPLQRKVWLKLNFHRLPFRFLLLYLYYVVVRGCWRAGWVGLTWARLRCDVMRYRELKRKEMELTGRVPKERIYGPGQPHPDVPQFE